MADIIIAAGVLTLLGFAALTINTSKVFAVRSKNLAISKQEGFYTNEMVAWRNYWKNNAVAIPTCGTDADAGGGKCTPVLRDEFDFGVVIAASAYSPSTYQIGQPLNLSATKVFDSKNTFIQRFAATNFTYRLPAASKFCASTKFPSAGPAPTLCLNEPLTIDVCGWPLTEAQLPPEPYHLSFFTDTFYDGNLGGRTGANNKCTQQASTSPLIAQLKPGATWKAFIATTGTSIQASVPFSGPVYALPYPVAVQPTPVKTSLQLIVSALGVYQAGRTFTQACNYPHICKFSVGSPYDHGGYQFWSGAEGSGAPSFNNCSNWTSSAGLGEAGSSIEPGDVFNDGSVSTHVCSALLPLLCISQ